MEVTEERQESVEVQINKFIEENCNKTKDEVQMMTIQSKVSLISMKNEQKYEEFKIGLRKAGYII